ncbi:MAG: thioredoxin [Pseudomonadota bacterium]
MLNLGGGSPTPSSDVIFDVTDATFMSDVIDASKERPIIVDFWAPWCGPCKTLGPALEKAVQAAGGKVALAKIDIDQSPMVAQQMRVQSIPAVFAFIDGQPVDGFMGAVPESQIKQFVDQLIKAAGGEGDQIEAALEQAEQLLGEGASAEAAQIFGAVLQADPTQLKAISGMARCYLANGDADNAKKILEMAPADKADDPAIVAAKAAIDLAEETAGAAENVSVFRERLQANENDHEARYELAMARLGTGDREGAVAELLEIFRRDRNWNEEAAKTQLLKLFEAFGPTDPVTLSGRRKLTSMIFA